MRTKEEIKEKKYDLENNNFNIDLFNKSMWGGILSKFGYSNIKRIDKRLS